MVRVLNRWLARALPGERESGDPWWVFRDADGQDNDWWPQLVSLGCYPLVFAVLFGWWGVLLGLVAAAGTLLYWGAFLSVAILVIYVLLSLFVGWLWALVIVALLVWWFIYR